MELLSPPYLRAGDLVGIVAPARSITPEEVEPAVKILRSWGLDVVCGNYLYSSHNQFAGTDSQRAMDLQRMIDDPKVKAILCARGGYGTIRLLSRLNLRSMQRNPKWLVGYSDITVLHGILNSWYLVETIHGVMPINFPRDGNENESTKALREVLFGKPLRYSIPANSMNRHGETNGILTGGNLSLLQSMARTDADINTDGKILFIEDLDEYLYHIDRMMMNLKLSGKLDGLAGLVVGSMKGMHDNSVPFGSTAYEIIMDAVREYDYPVCFGFPAGHQEPNMPLIMGRYAELRVDDLGARLGFHSTAYSQET